MKKKGILFFFHCKSNTGYAIKSLEDTFFRAARRKYHLQNIHFAYPDLSSGKPDVLPDDFTNLIIFNSNCRDNNHLKFIKEYIRTNKIETVMGFDQGPYKKSYKYLRGGGIAHFISYWGAPMGSLNKGLKLMLKRIQTRLLPYQPDLFVFESRAMADTAIYGRGIPKNKITIVHLGVDTEYFKPSHGSFAEYAYKQFNIPFDRKIIFYSGHMEARKGVKTIMEAAVILTDKYDRKDIHFLLLGNKAGEEKPYTSFLKSQEAAQYVTFGGYRNDIAKLHQSCCLGVIASTGWDSFTVSSIEMAASGLPLVVSSLQGLRETIVEGKTGYLFPPGNSDALAQKIISLTENRKKREQFSQAARRRARQHFDKKLQIDNIAALI